MSKDNVEGTKINPVSSRDQQTASGTDIIQADVQGSQSFQTVLDQGEMGVLKVRGREIVIPTLRSTEEEMNAFTRFLTTFQLGDIERRKQKKLREILAKAEIDVLSDRTEAIVKAHRGLTKACLAEILVAAHEFGLEALRNAEISNQEALQQAVLRVALQYVDFVRRVPSDLPPEVFEQVQKQAQGIYEQALAKVRSATFTVE